MPKHRSSQACQGCRAAKTKCEVESGESICCRCRSTSTECFFPRSRRGRIKGSKNRRTLEKLRDEKGSIFGSTYTPGETFDDDAISPNDSTSAPSSSIPGSNVREPEGLRTSTRTSGTTTPWNPHHLMMNTERGQYSNRPTLSRKLRNILGDFPVEDNRSDHAPSNPKGFQDPLWLMAGLADRGWDLEASQGTGVDKQSTLPLLLPNLPVEDAKRLRKWTRKTLQGIEVDQRRYFEHGLLGSKFDVSRDLDPVYHGLISLEKAQTFLDAYWELIHPQWAMLDCHLHTLEYLQSRSALLTTTVLAIGATALSALSPEPAQLVDEALRLHAHTEKLSLVVYATGARSNEIIQAQILLCRWGLPPRSRLDEQRWTRAGMIPRMASEIGLNYDRQYDNSEKTDTGRAERLRLNDIRLRLFIIINEFRFSTYSGRNPVDLSDFEPTEDILQDMYTVDGNIPASITALYNLYLFDKGVRRRLAEYKPGPENSVSLDAELANIKAYTDKWINDWCPGKQDKHLDWHLRHDVVSCGLLLAVNIARKRLQYPPTSRERRTHEEANRAQQQMLLDLSSRMFKQALEAPDAVLMTHRGSTFAFAAAVLLRLGKGYHLILRTALRMAGDPEQPFVPAFVRESGNQMLLLLCSNRSKSRTESPGPLDVSEEVLEPQNEQHDSFQVEEEFTTPPDHNQRDQHRSGLQHERHPVSSQQGLSAHDTYAQPYLGFGATFGSQMDSDTLFGFNIADFPCIPDSHPTNMYDGGDVPIRTPYAPADLDAWIAPILPQHANTEETPQHFDQFQELVGNADIFQPPAGVSQHAMLDTNDYSQQGSWGGIR